MHAVWLMLWLAQPGVYGLRDEAEVTRRFLEGDLVTLTRSRALLRSEGRRTDLGRLGLLDDLSRLARCLPLGPIPRGELSPFLAARRLARLERIRLERRRLDGAHRQTDLEPLLERVTPYPVQRQAPSAHMVRWPAGKEVWSDEIADPEVSPPSCNRAGSREPEAVRARARAERALVAELTRDAASLPPRSAGLVAYAYLRDALNTKGFVMPEEWIERSGRWLDALDAPYRTAGRIAQARLAERAGAREDAIRFFRLVLTDESRSVEEDSRVRARLVQLLEPDFEAILTVVENARALRNEDRGVLDNARARALYSLGRSQELVVAGREWAASAPRKSKLTSATLDVYLRGGLALPPEGAVRFAEALGPASTKDDRVDELARLALEHGRTDLAARAYDHLRAEAETRRRGAAYARWTGARLVVAYHANAGDEIDGLIDTLLSRARTAEKQGRPSSAVARELARTCQDLLPPMTERDHEPRTQRTAKALLAAVRELTSRPSRWRKALARFESPLARLAGLPSEPPKRAIHRLGEIVIPRLPEPPSAEDIPSYAPPVRSFLVHQLPSGAWRFGAPWKKPLEAGAPDSRRRDGEDAEAKAQSRNHDQP